MNETCETWWKPEDLCSSISSEHTSFLPGLNFSTTEGRLTPRSSHTKWQDTFPDNVCSYSPPVTVCHLKIWLLFFFLNFFNPKKLLVQWSIVLKIRCTPPHNSSDCHWQSEQSCCKTKWQSELLWDRRRVISILLDTTMIDLMWVKQTPSIILEEINKEDTHTTHTHTHTLPTHSLTLHTYTLAFVTHTPIH